MTFAVITNFFFSEHLAAFSPLAVSWTARPAGEHGRFPSGKGSASSQQRALAQKPLFLFSSRQESAEAVPCGVRRRWHFLRLGWAGAGRESRDPLGPALSTWLAARPARAGGD